jgi:cytoskeleton protein RodZ
MARSRQKRSSIATPLDTGSASGDSPGAPRFDGVGATLRAERLRRGWELADVANYLKIRRVHLEAIEAERFDEIPAGTYAVNFVRSYSEALGLDAVEMVRRFREELAGGSTRRLELHFPQPLPESRLPGGVIILVSVAIAALGYGAWTSFNQDQRDTLARVDSVPQQLQSAVPPPPAAPAAAATTPPAVPPPPAVPAPPASVPAASPAPTTPREPTSGAATEQRAAAASPPAPAVAAVPPPAVAVPPAPPRRPRPRPPWRPPSPPCNRRLRRRSRRPIRLRRRSEAAVTENANGTRVFGEPGTATRVVITAQADSWVQVRDASGGIVFMRILKAGDAYHVPNRAGLLLTTGSAGSIDIKVDGRQAPSLGRAGFVRRDVPLEPERLMSGGSGAGDPVRPPQPAAGRSTGG